MDRPDVRSVNLKLLCVCKI